MSRQALALGAAAALVAAVWGLAHAAPRRERPAARAPSPFEPHWQDGKAELDGYRYTVVRYGQERTGQALMIFVTEPFSKQKHVKVDDPSRNPGDTFEALKLNFVRDFQTGIYDYNTMVSVFASSRDFSPVKITFSAMEWCGSVYEELNFDGSAVSDMLRSYFEGESRTGRFPDRRGGIAEDNLFILLRSLRGSDFLRPGERRSTPFLPSAFYRRLGHAQTAWIRAEIERLAQTERLATPAGAFETDVYVVRPSDGRTGRFWVERAYPHRIVRWAWTPPAAARGRMGRDGCDSGELSGSKRLPYWTLNAEGGEANLKDLGLRPGAPGPHSQP
jgi:hypothetical protein